MGAGEVLRLGPFTGGLNKAADPSVVGDQELIDCVNFELDIDGSLVNRPPIKITQQGLVNTRLLIFGSVEFSGTHYLFATRGGETYVSSNFGSSWTELAPGGTNRECITMAVYANTVWLPATPGSAGGGMSWTPGGGAVAVAAIPRASACVVHKNRLYLCPGETATSDESRLFFSAAANFTSWPGANFIDVSPGDGTTLNNVVVYQDNLLLFKQDSTFVLAYDLDPVDAILREVNSVVGTTGHFGVAQHENTAFCFHNNNVYSIINYTFELLNLKVPFEYDSTLPTGTTARYEPQSLSILGDRLVARYYNKTYVFGLRTATWSEWMKTDTTETIEWHLFGPLIRGDLIASIGRYRYFTGYSFDVSSGGYKVIQVVDGHTSGEIEGFGDNVMHCTATTKDYDFADPVRFKRLFWWGADLLSGNQITADIQPITLNFTPTWSQLGSPLTWASLGTWGNPLSGGTLPTQTVVPADNVFNTNKMVKFLKSMRFRKANFSVQLITDGSQAQLSKIFSYIAIVRTKQTVSKVSS